MYSPTDRAVLDVIDQQRKEAALRRESLGPLVEAVGVLRATTETVRYLLDELETQVGAHLELLDIVMRTAHGNRWWEQLTENLAAERGER